jgi:hypothetical protein
LLIVLAAFHFVASLLSFFHTTPWDPMVGEQSVNNGVACPDSHYHGVFLVLRADGRECSRFVMNFQSVRPRDKGRSVAVLLSIKGTRREWPVSLVL